MQTITPKELLKRFEEVEGSKIITVVMNTEVRLLKRNRDTKEPCPFKAVRKRMRCNVLIGTDYERGVNTRLSKEGKEADFEAQEHSWATRTDKPVISVKGDQFYANVRIKETYEVEYTHNGKEISKEELAPFMPKKSPPKNQGTEKPVLWRNPKIFPECSIESYKSDGQEVLVRS